ncbi:MAG: hypothetical protein P5686_26265, partial [Limnospira sp. PMC 1254.20]|uniref:hypothetical protein n=1 Tax=Limnospira sp. PMC 1254.20 TaxID=2981052 RepID=UPI0028E14F33
SSSRLGGVQRNPTTGICFPRGCWVPPGRCDRSPVVGWVECNGTQQRVYVSPGGVGFPQVGAIALQ